MPYQNKNRRKIEAAKAASKERLERRRTLMDKLGQAGYSRKIWAACAATRAMIRPARKSGTKRSIRSTGRHFVPAADGR